MTQYFEDMWLGLENELKQFDNLDSPFADHSGEAATSPSEQGDITEQVTLQPNTYEQLLQSPTPTPSSVQMRSKNLADRIEAVRIEYNQNPIAFNASSVARLTKVAENLRKKSLVNADDYSFLLDMFK